MKTNENQWKSYESEAPVPLNTRKTNKNNENQRKNIGKPRTLFANHIPAQTVPPIFLRQEPKSFEKSTH